MRIFGWEIRWSDPDPITGWVPRTPDPQDDPEAAIDGITP
jgi:hypothetical protein